MYGAILDDMIGIAVAEALMTAGRASETIVKQMLIQSMQKWGRKYPYAGYGVMFSRWLQEKNPEPYGSFTRR